jgi:hypothetical protein
MNVLQTLVSRQLITKKLSKHQLASIIGYTNISKGLRVIHNFITTLTESNDVRSKLQQALDIPSKDYKAAIEQVEVDIEKLAQQAFTPSIQVILSGRPSPVFAAIFFIKVDIPEGIESLQFTNEINCVFDCYIQNQNAHFSGTSYYTDSGDDYLPFVEALEKAELFNKPIPWSFGNGFRYFRKYKDTLTFDRRGNLINRAGQYQKSVSTLNVNGKSIPPSFFK